MTVRLENFNGTAISFNVLEDINGISYCLELGETIREDFECSVQMLKDLNFITCVSQINDFQTRLLEERERVAECEKKDIEPYK